MHAWEGNPHQPAMPDDGMVARPDRSIDPDAGGWRVLLAVAGGILLAAFLTFHSNRGAFSDVTHWLTRHEKLESSALASLSQQDPEHLDQEKPQRQAEFLLERAVNHYGGATGQISARVAGWQGKLRLTPQLNSMLSTALNSDDLGVRAAAIDVDLAALGLTKTPQTLQRLMEKVESGPQSQRIWALWEMGLLANRGVEPERVSQILIRHLHDPNPEVRHWAVEGLAYVGTDDAIAPLLKVFHDDPSPMVRERAGCGLAQSGMLTPEQRRKALPQLLDFAADKSLDAQTQGWVYQALRDITRQSLPNDPAAWRDWYESVGGN